MTPSKLTKTEKKLLAGFAGREGQARKIRMRYEVAVKRLRDRGLITAEMGVQPNGRTGRGGNLYWQIALIDAAVPRS